MNQNYICAACDNSYMIINILTSKIQVLFPFEPEIDPFIQPYLEVGQKKYLFYFK